MITTSIYQEKYQPLSRLWLTSTSSTSEAAKPANFKPLKQPTPKTSTEATEKNIPQAIYSLPSGDVAKIIGGDFNEHHCSLGSLRTNQAWVDIDPLSAELVLGLIIPVEPTQYHHVYSLPSTIDFFIAQNTQKLHEMDSDHRPITLTVGDFQM
ncbi:hypothetical protein GWI33_007397 [Rhynchophorus ferrugineus]|uniref:Endonuclease/exonuclease/phosphatase domain-containing protein n=1 Tax=Rhynchophorus ferrugineus TaxID=354439 RepID=A0A834MK54_RHYFE|nr:hypothetical protein GWI33_007397 [Rhynchophorus ferrugineus]